MPTPQDLDTLLASMTYTKTDVDAMLALLLPIENPLAPENRLEWSVNGNLTVYHPDGTLKDL